MATSPIEKITGTWESVSISAESTVGQISAYKNDALKLAVINYNSSANTNVEASISLPASIYPKFSIAAALRGDGYLNVSSVTNKLSIICPNKYSPGSIVYVIN